MVRSSSPLTKFHRRRNLQSVWSYISSSFTDKVRTLVVSSEGNRQSCRAVRENRIAFKALLQVLFFGLIVGEYGLRVSRPCNKNYHVGLAFVKIEESTSINSAIDAPHESKKRTSSAEILLSQHYDVFS